MPHFVTDKCINCKYTDCVEVCPISCFYEGKNMLVINPEECINCQLCITECPISAISSDLEDNMPDAKKKFWIDKNNEFAQKWGKRITSRKSPMKCAKEFEKKKNKFEEYFDERVADDE